MRKKILFFVKTHFWFIAFLAFLFLFAWKIFIKGYLIGPFDFLVGFYDPFREINWGDQTLNNAARHYKNFQMSDVVSVVLPVKLYAIRLLQSWQMPLWNPYILNGSPLFANIQSAILYPLNLVYFIFSNKTAYNVYILSQLAMAFLFMFLYLRVLKLSKTASYFGAVAFSFSAFFIVWLPWGTLGHSFLWLPLILYSLEKYSMTRLKRYTFLTIAGLVFSFFAGHTQTTFIVFSIALLYGLFKIKIRNKALLILPFLLSFLLIGIQLIPAIEMYFQSVRGTVSTLSFYKDQTLYFSSYLTSVFPDFFGNPVTRNWWGKTNYAESAIYFGTTAFYFFIYALFRKKKINRSLFTFLLTLIIVSILITTQNFFSHLVFLLKIPLISSSTFARYTAIYIFAGSILTAYGLALFLEDLKKNSFKLINILNSLFLSFLIIFWTTILIKKLPQDYLNNLLIIKRNSVLPTAILLVLIFGSWFFTYVRLHLKQKKYQVFLIPSFSILVILVLSLELLRFSWKYTPFSPGQFFFPRHPLITQLRTLTQNARYIGYVPTDTNTLYRLRTAEGAEPLYNKNLAEIAIYSNGYNAPITDRAAMQIPDGPLKPKILDLFSTKYFVDKTDNFRNTWIGRYGEASDYDDRFKEIWTDGTFKIYINNYALNRQKIFYNVVKTDQQSEVGKILADDFDIQKSITVSDDVDIDLRGEGKYSIRVIEDKPTFQKYTVETDKPGIFMITDIYYPGWKAMIDNKNIQILKVNHAFRGVLIPQGTHNLTFNYFPDSFRNGLILSTIGLVLLLVYLIPKKRWKTN